MTILDVNNNSFYNKFEYNIENAVEALKKEFGQQFSISKSVREQHTRPQQFIHQNYLMELFLLILEKMFKKL